MSSTASHQLFALLVLTLAAGVACGLDDTSGGGDTEAMRPLADPAANDPLETERIEQLSAIGYVAGSEQAHDSEGVTRLDPRRVAPGSNLMTSGHGPVALLMDMEGEILHEWRAEFERVFTDHPKRERAKQARRNFWRDVLLLPNGDIIVIWELFGIFKLDRNSRVLWAVPEPVHHALQLTAAGEIVHLQAKRKMIAGIPEKQAIEDFIVVRDSEGAELRRLAISDALRNADWPALRRNFWKRSSERGYDITKRGLYDPFHTNSLWLLSSAEAARLGDSFRAGDALVSMAMLDTIAVIDLTAETARWWQQGPFGMQHSPRPTPDGGIALFNNFLAKGRSSLLTLDPRTRTVLREYTGPEEEPLHSKRSGQVHLLPNGNILIVETDGGRALELAADGELVWEFRSPYRVGSSGDKVAHLYSLKRVGAAQTAWLD